MDRGTAATHGCAPVTRARLARRLTGLAVLVGVTLGCAEPAAVNGDPASGADEPTATDQLDPLNDDLREEVVELAGTVAGIRGHLAEVADAADTQAAGRAAEAALDTFLDVPDDAVGGLFPSTESAAVRGGDGDDAVTTTLNAARRAGGELGRSVVEVIRDPIVGDLGALERDPAGVIEAARAATQGVASTSSAIESVAELPGEGVRALAWTFLAAETGSLKTARAAGERAEAHLGVVAVAVELLLEDVGDSGAGEPDTASTAAA